MLAVGTHRRGERTNVTLSLDRLCVKQYLDRLCGYELSLGLCVLVADSIEAFCNIALIRFYLFQLAFIWDSVFLEQSLLQTGMSWVKQL